MLDMSYQGLPKASKRQLKLSGQSYAEQSKRLGKSLAKQIEELALEERSLRIKRAREQVLADLIATQEVTISLLEQQQQWLDVLAAENCVQGLQDAGTAAVPSSTPSASTRYQISSQQVTALHDRNNGSSLRYPQVRAVSAVAAPEQQQQPHQNVPELSGNMSYIAGLLAKATPAQLRQVLNMTADDWQQYKHDHFMRLVVLLELVNRPSSYEECEGFGGQDAAMEEAIKQQQQKQQQALHSAGSRCAPASSSGTGTGTDTSEGAAAGAADPGGLRTFDIPSRFKAVVDEGITLSFLALFFNHLTIVNASANHDLPQQVAPPGLWLRVVKKLNLTEQQLLQLRLASEEFTRLNKCSAAQGEALLDRASCPSLLLAAEASIQAATSSYSNTLSSAGAGSAGSATTPSAGSSGPSTVSGETAAAAKPAGGPPKLSAVAAAAAAAAAAVAVDAAEVEGEQDQNSAPLDDLLQRHVRLQFVYMVMIGMFVFNTLTRVQIAQMTVGCYPYYPMLTAVAEAAAVIHRQQEVEEEKRIRARRRKHLRDSDDEEQNMQPDDGDEGDYAKQQLREHQQQRSQLLQLQQQFWQQQLELNLQKLQVVKQEH